MKKFYILLIAIAVAALFIPAGIQAQESKACGSSVRPCSSCPRCNPCPATECPRCNPCPSTECPRCGNPCPRACPSAQHGEYKRDVLDNKIPTKTQNPGDWHVEESTGYRNTLVTGSEEEMGM